MSDVSEKTKGSALVPVALPATPTKSVKDLLKSLDAPVGELTERYDDLTRQYKKVIKFLDSSSTGSIDYSDLLSLKFKQAGLKDIIQVMQILIDQIRLEEGKSTSVSSQQMLQPIVVVFGDSDPLARYLARKQGKIIDAEDARHNTA